MPKPTFNPNASYESVKFDPNAEYSGADFESKIAAPQGELRPQESNWSNRWHLTDMHPVDSKMPLSESVPNFAADIGAGVLQVALHPVKTAQGLVASLIPDEVIRWSLDDWQKNVIEPWMKAHPGKPIPKELQITAEDEQLANTPNPVRGMYEGLNTKPAETIAQGIGQTAAISPVAEFAGPVTRGLVEKASKAREGVKGKLSAKYGPRKVEIAGEKVPVTVGEAEPGSPAGRTQSQLKRSGAGAEKFEKVEKAQQQAVKGVIKKTAQKASGFIGPMQEEAGAVVDDAATASFRKAEPLYNNLDETLKTVPASFSGVSKIVQDAMTRARKLGVSISEDSGDISKIRPDKEGAIQWGGTKISKVTHPERWAKLVEEGIIDDSGQSTPFRTYRMVRSQLLKMQRAATDDATRFAIGNEIKTMDANIDAALKGTGLEKSWSEANRLWREGKARIKVADAIKSATKGTPESAQAPGISKVPTEIQGASLVNKLNALEEDGTLQDAFTRDEINNIRQSADILDRIQRTPVGRGSGESMSFARGLTHAVRGFKGPMIGAGIGAVTEGLTGGSVLRGAEVGAGIGFIVQSIGERALVNVMTKLDGVKALKAVEEARTPSQADAALSHLQLVAAGITGIAVPKGPKIKKIQDDAEYYRTHPR